MAVRGRSLAALGMTLVRSVVEHRLRNAPHQPRRRARNEPWHANPPISRPGHGPRQRRQLHAVVRRSSFWIDLDAKQFG
jgi:hypothetical protein